MKPSRGSDEFEVSRPGGKGEMGQGELYALGEMSPVSFAEGGKPSSTSVQGAIDRLSSWIDSMVRQLTQVCQESTRALVAAVEAKDAFTRHHSANVARYCVAICREMGLSEQQQKVLENAAVLHDIGKIGVPDAILNKPGPLTDEEFAVIRQHPQIGVTILSHTSYLKEELPIILAHHERWDGKGYPNGLAGEQIPLGARVLNVADTIETMLSRRSYKAPCSLEDTMRELKLQSGKQFDPEVADFAYRWLERDGKAEMIARWKAVELQISIGA